VWPPSVIFLEILSAVERYCIRKIIDISERKKSVKREQIETHLTENNTLPHRQNLIKADQNLVFILF
jgi:hypothetical protein